MDRSVIASWWKNHAPSLGQVQAVYGVITLLVYGWTIYWYLWKLPSYVYFLTITEMLVVFAYAVAMNFIESLMVLALPFLLSLLLPAKWFRDVFVSRGTALVIVLLIFLMRYIGIITAYQDIPASMLYLAPAAILVMGLVAFLAGWIAFVRRILDEVASRAVIFLYVLIPLSLISLLVVAIRNLLA
jgi:hypothetical protein